jgi:hypothetical protein
MMKNALAGDAAERVVIEGQPPDVGNSEYTSTVEFTHPRFPARDLEHLGRVVDADGTETALGECEGDDTRAAAQVECGDACEISRNPIEVRMERIRVVNGVLPRDVVVVGARSASVKLSVLARPVVAFVFVSNDTKTVQPTTCVRSGQRRSGLGRPFRGRPLAGSEPSLVVHSAAHGVENPLVLDQVAIRQTTQ